MKDVTEDFKRISNEIIKIECQLRQTQPELAVHVAKVQDYEKQQLEVVSRKTISLIWLNGKVIDEIL